MNGIDDPDQPRRLQDARRDTPGGAAQAISDDVQVLIVPDKNVPYQM